MTCTRCRGTHGVTVQERLNPRNLRPVHLPLCQPCGKLLGYHSLDFSRANVTATSLGAPPGLVLR